MANLARLELPPVTSDAELYAPISGVGRNLLPPADEAEMTVRLARAAALLKRMDMPAVGGYDGPEVSGR